MAVDSTMPACAPRPPGFSLPEPASGKPVSCGGFGRSARRLALICHHFPYVPEVRRGLGQLRAGCSAADLETVAFSADDWSATAGPPQSSWPKESRVQGTRPYWFDQCRKAPRARIAACTPDSFLFGPGCRPAYGGASTPAAREATSRLPGRPCGRRSARSSPASPCPPSSTRAGGARSSGTRATPRPTPEGTRPGPADERKAGLRFPSGWHTAETALAHPPRATRRKGANVGDTSEIRELIRAAAEGATGGVRAMRAAGIPAVLSGFAVEIDYAGGAGPGPELGAIVRLSITAESGGGGCTPTGGEEVLAAAGRA